MKLMKWFLFVILLSGCVGYGKPAPYAGDAWHKRGVDKPAVEAAMKDCQFVDRLSIGVLAIRRQHQCMIDKGFELDDSGFRPDNCYGDAPSGCVKVLPTGPSPMVAASWKPDASKPLGEQVKHAIPTDWKLAYAKGGDMGPFVQEYIPKDEDIESWKTGYLMIRRFPYPDQKTFSEVQKSGKSLAEFMAEGIENEAKSKCQKHRSLKKTKDKTEKIVINAGFCYAVKDDLVRGEGSVIGFIEGKSNMFMLQYGWRVELSEKELEKTPFGKEESQINELAEAIKQTTLCGIGHVACPNPSGK